MFMAMSADAFMPAVEGAAGLRSPGIAAGRRAAIESMAKCMVAHFNLVLGRRGK
jgi:hypothetical protein